jgi:hypothetical protein
MDDKEPFLSRWSRRKLGTKEVAPAGTAKTAESGAAAAAARLPPAGVPPAPESPEIGTPEFREFFDPRVDETLRRTALKKLFSDPHYNVMDGLDTYIDDYSKPDPIPEAMLRQLNQAKDLFLFDDEKKPADGAGGGEKAAAESATTASAASADGSALANPAAADAPGADVAAGATARPPPERARNA